MLELYHHGSSVCAAKVRFALAEKGLEWRGRYVDILAGEQFTPEFLTVNPKAVVPALVHDGRVVPESTVICEYLEDIAPEPPLYPRDAYERAQARLWAKTVDEELHPACSALTYIVSHRHAILRSGADSFEAFLERGADEGRAARERKWQWIRYGLEAPGAAEQVRAYAAAIRRMQDALAERDWLVGERFSIADLAMAPYVNRLETLAMDGLWRDGRLPGVERWFERIRERRAFRDAITRWMPGDVAAEMHAHGRDAWPDVEAMLEAGRG